MHVPSIRPADRSTGRTAIADLEPAPPEIIRFRSRGISGDYYQALSTAAAVRLRLLGTLHARSELAGPAAREVTRRRLAAQQRQAWQQLLWLVAEMNRLDTGPDPIGHQDVVGQLGPPAVEPGSPAQRDERAHARQEDPLAG